MATANSNLETLLNEHEVARITGLSVASVRRWRLLRRGPSYKKIGAAVRYRPQDVEAWLASRPTGGERALPKAKRAYRCSRRASELLKATATAIMGQITIPVAERQVQRFEDAARACRRMLTPEDLGQLAHMMARFLDLVRQQRAGVKR